VAAGLATAALGSDTGGSIRIPAAVTGTVGLKPTYGAVSKRGVFPLSSSLDTVGPITRTVRDAAIIFDAISGHDPRDPDSTTVEQASAVDFGQDLKGIRIGVPRQYFFDRLQTSVANVTEGVINIARELGAEVIDTPWTDAALARSAAMIINRVETVDVHVESIQKHPEFYGQELRERVQATALFPRDRYRKALQVREHVKHSMERLFAEHRLSALLTPTVPGVAVPAADLYVRYDDGTAEPVTLSYTRLTQPFNATGQPALSIPAGIDKDRLPISVQLVGKPFGEAELCRIGSALDNALDWRGEMSPLRMARYGSPDIADF
jgi:aspartyl-tRNA(Asn)/glutamyl-tRNA(Gln) amidotransferase subunit A